MPGKAGSPVQVTAQRQGVEVRRNMAVGYTEPVGAGAGADGWRLVRLEIGREI